MTGYPQPTSDEELLLRTSRLAWLKAPISFGTSARTQPCEICSGQLKVIADGHEIFCLCRLLEYEALCITRTAELSTPVAVDLPRLSEFQQYGGSEWPSMQRAIVKAGAIMADPFDANWLTVMGGVGCGKTRLLQAIYADIKAYAVYIQAGDLNGMIHRSFGDRDTEDVVEELVRIPVLLLDDWGAQGGAGSDTVAGLVTRILDRRYIFGRQRPTVVSTNLNPTSLAVLNPRVADRILDIHLVDQCGITLPSFRRLGAKPLVVERRPK